MSSRERMQGVARLTSLARGMRAQGVNTGWVNTLHEDWEN